MTAAAHKADCAGTPGSRTPSTASLDACGYPSPDNTGVPAGTRLTPRSGDITVTTPGATIDAIALTEGTIHVDANIPNDHYEPIYYGGGGGSLIVNHDTLLNPHSWTAAVFTKTDFGDIDTVQIVNSVLAGGGYTLYGGLGGNNNNGNVNGPETVENNRFARLYYPNSGYWGTEAYFPSRTTWTRNIWDDTLAPVPGP